ncbi:MAG TPA: hypothetical protein VLE54_05730 [Thermoanaerobaculia bacterium]|nr:hypothetical protein [Thermoanaerobaculia bacterium]
MADRRSHARLVLSPANLQRLICEKVDEDEVREHDQTQPMRLSFLALLAERDPQVQARLNLRRDHALEAELRDDPEDERPTDEMILGSRS